MALNGLKKSLKALRFRLAIELNYLNILNKCAYKNFLALHTLQ